MRCNLDKSTMNKIMEYMALGKPVVQFDLTEGRCSAQQASLYARQNDPFDLAEGRYSAQRASLYARKNDASSLAATIVEVLDDPARCAKMGEFGRRRVENELEWRHEAPKLLAAYEVLWRGVEGSPAAQGVET